MSSSLAADREPNPVDISAKRESGSGAEELTTNTVYATGSRHRADKKTPSLIPKHNDTLF